MKSSFSQNEIFNKKGNSYDSFFLLLCLTPFAADIKFIALLLSQIYDFLYDFLPTIQCARQKMMTSAKGLAYLKNLCYKCYKTYIQSCFVPSLHEIEQILNNLERMFQWLPQPKLFDLKKGQLLQSPYVDKFEVKLNKP